MSMSDYLWEEHGEEALPEPKIHEAKTKREFDELLAPYIEWLFAMTFDTEKEFEVLGPVTVDGNKYIGMERFVVADVSFELRDGDIILSSLKVRQVKNEVTHHFNHKNLDKIVSMFGQPGGNNSQSPVSHVMDWCEHIFREDGDLFKLRKFIEENDLAEKYKDLGFGGW